MMKKESIKEACGRSMAAYINIAETGAEFPIVEVTKTDQIDILMVAEDMEVQQFMAFLGTEYARENETVTRVTLASGAYYHEAKQDPKTKRIVQQGERKECVVVATMNFLLESHIEMKKLERIKGRIVLTDDMPKGYEQAHINVLSVFWTTYSKTKMSQRN